MTLKEKILYIKGRKNPNGYSFNPFDYFTNRRRAKFICLIIVIGFVFEFLCLIGVISWQKLLSATNLVNSVKQQDSNFVVYYLDVGQSDCTIVICDDEVLMIDTGTINQLKNIRTNLYMLEIDTIDYMLLTHPHDDHIGSAADIIEHYSVSNVLMPEISAENPVTTLTYDNLFDMISENNVNPESVSYGDSFMLGSAVVEILAPIKQDENINNMSVITKITYGNTSFLFPGDAEEEIEKQILREKIDVSANILKVGHHGSNTSSTDAFISAVKPEYVVISAGSDNNYGHPTLNNIEKFVDLGIKPYMTAVDGHITVTSDGENLTIITENDKN